MVLGRAILSIQELEKTKEALGLDSGRLRNSVALVSENAEGDTGKAGECSFMLNGFAL